MPIEIHYFAVFPQVRFLSDGQIFAFYLLSTEVIQQAILDIIFFFLMKLPLLRTATKLH